MSVAEPRSQRVESSMDDLSITTPSRRPPPKPRAKSAIADSWDQDSDDNNEQIEGLPDTHTVPSAPPPTPMSPNYTNGRSALSVGMDEHYGPSGSLGSNDGGLLNPMRAAHRPEKQVDTAGRLIAGALGVRKLQQTEEQKEYARVVREKEARRREKEKEEAKRGVEERERARVSVWED